MEAEGRAKQIPIRSSLLRSEVQDTFWVSLIGRGCPAPRHKFRWCTERLKIKPASAFIENKVSVHGELILFLGARRAESSRRAANLDTRAKAGDKTFGL